jgi:hypothetical protein
VLEREAVEEIVDQLGLQIAAHILSPFGIRSIQWTPDRGIFLNDEDFGLQPWAAKTFEPETGDIGPKTYARIFSLLLYLFALVVAVFTLPILALGLWFLAQGSPLSRLLGAGGGGPGSGPEASVTAPSPAPSWSSTSPPTKLAPAAPHIAEQVGERVRRARRQRRPLLRQP